jgi:ribosomal protein S18 acetylase RimI-like enzyme
MCDDDAPTVGLMHGCGVRIRDVRAADVTACHAIEQVCFEPSEAALEHSVRVRQQRYPEGFLVAVVAGQVAGFVNSGSTNQADLADEAFKDMVGHDPRGASIVIFSIAVDPAHQGTGVSTRLLNAFVERATLLSKQRILLLCKDELVDYYLKFGFLDMGPSGSSHGGFRWREMRREL